MITDLPTKRIWPLSQWQIFLRVFTYKTAAKINWHRYGTKFRHCYPMYTCVQNWLRINHQPHYFLYIVSIVLDYNYCIFSFATCKWPMALCCLINILTDWSNRCSQSGRDADAHGQWARCVLTGRTCCRYVTAVHATQNNWTVSEWAVS